MNDVDDKKYGLPELKKFPMPDARHVRSAIKFFNYVSPRREKELARAILARMKEYGMSFDDFIVGEENRFSKYVPKDELKHYGILGMHWGVRRYQNPDGTLTEAGKRHYSKLDDKWASKHASKIQSKAMKKSQREMNKVERQLKRQFDPRTRQYMNAYNQNLARIMSTKVSDLSTPSGRAVNPQLRKARSAMLVTLAGIDVDTREVQPSKQRYGIVWKVSFTGKVTLWSEVQPEKW